MAGIPYTFFYQSEYLNDTQHLTREQHGSYLLLLMSYWNSGKPLNNKNGRLAVIAKMTKEEWAQEEEIYAEFFDIEGDIWTHGRCEFDLDRVRKKSSQAAYAGRKSAESKKGTSVEQVQEPVQEPVEELQSDQKQTPVAPKPNNTSTAVQHQFNERSTMYEGMYLGMKEKDFVQIAFEHFWKLYPRRQAKKNAIKSFEIALKKASIEEILEGVDRYVKFLETKVQEAAMPTTWLNGERWNDEIIPQTAKVLQFTQPKHEPVLDPYSQEQYCLCCGQTWPCLTESKKGLVAF